MATVEENGLVWKRSNNGHLHEEDEEDCEVSQEEIWDDTALIKAYDRAVQRLKDNIEDEEEKPNTRTTSKRKKKEKQCKWKVGQKCLALYSEDEMFYEAVILELSPSRSNIANGSALVQFDHYSNQQETPFSDLLPEEYKHELEAASTVAECCDEDRKNDVTGTSTETEEGDDGVCKEEEEEEESGVQQSFSKNWKVSDLCYVPDGKGHYVQAVLNAFVSSCECNVTLVDTEKRKKVKISMLSQHNNNDNNNNNNTTAKGKSKKKSSASRETESSKINSSLFDFPIPQYHHHHQQQQYHQQQHHQYHPSQFGFSPPPPPMPYGFGSSSMPDFTSNFYGPSSSRYTAPPPPPPPPPPILTEEVIRGDEEALANMLMSWYMNGYHTGYYRGLQQGKDLKQQQPQQNKKKD